MSMFRLVGGLRGRWRLAWPIAVAGVFAASAAVGAVMLSRTDTVAGLTSQIIGEELLLESKIRSIELVPALAEDLRFHNGEAPLAARLAAAGAELRALVAHIGSEGDAAAWLGVGPKGSSLIDDRQKDSMIGLAQALESVAVAPAPERTARLPAISAASELVLADLRALQQRRSAAFREAVSALKIKNTILIGLVVAAILSAALIAVRVVLGGERQRQRAEAAARDVNERLALVASHASDMVMITDAEGRIEWVNSAFEATTGYTLAECLGRKPGAFLQGPETDPQAIAKMAAGVRAGEPVTVEIVNYSKAGRAYWLDLRIHPVRAADGRVTRFIAVERDISEAKAVEAELQRAYTTLQQTGTIARVGGWSLDLASGALEWSDETFRIFGCDPAAGAPSREDFLAMIREDWRIPFEDAVRGTLATGVPYRIEIAIIRPDGQSRWIEASGKPEFENGAAVRLVGAAQDITERRALADELQQSAKLLDEVCSVARVGGWSVQADGRSIKWTREVFKIYGVDPETFNPSIENSLAFYRDGGAEQLAAAVEACAARGEQFDLELPFRNAAGDDLWVRVSGVPDMADGRLLRVYGAFQDITQEKLEALERESAVRRIEAAAAAKTRFLATMSHELRTPLTGILGMLDLLVRSDLDGQRRYYAQSALEASRSLLAIVNDVLDTASIEAGRVSINPAKASVREIAESVRRLFSVAAIDKGLSFEVAVDAGVPDGVMLDAARLRQVLTNLVGNAVKFTQTGSVSLTIAWAGGRLRAVCDDTGIGFDPSEKDRLFRPFEQADDSAARSYEGSGLGLAIAAGIVRAMGGTIDAHSVKGAGSRFWFEVPAEQAADGCVARTGEGVVDAARPLAILVAEDHPLNQQLIRLILAAAGADATIVTNGAEAVEAVRRQMFDLVLMDIRMPVMDGIDAMLEIRALPGGRSLPIIAVTADIVDGQADRLRGLGFDGFVAKPIEQEQLLGTIAGLVERIEAQQPNAA